MAKKEAKKKRSPWAKRDTIIQTHEMTITALEKTVEEQAKNIEILEKEIEEFEKIQRFQKTAMWTTAEGYVLPVTEMEDRHLQNTTFYLFRRLMSSLGHARYLDGLTKNVRHLLDMLNEAERRGLRL